MRTFIWLFVLLLLGGCGNVLVALHSDTIAENPTKRTLGRRVEDESIETKSTVNINNASQALRESHVNVVSYNGYVLIVGQVPSQAAKDQATEIVRPLTGVRRIYNELKVAAPSSTMTRTSDTWITSKVKSLLVARKDIYGQRVKVTTENGVVYLMGMATAAQAKLITDVARDVSGVQRVVSLMEIVNPN
ncbi:MAG: phospholipid-binding protein [Gammaproteobacteria bacterium]|nr:MAG: phospholipid-binding protein [Gammaproteobacteria bacterium]PIE37528.1 MAG: phospholipid-binding protein [Gammaproteobacteria bacterium]